MHKQSEPSPDSLSKKVIHGGAWILGLRVINRSLGFIRTIILARLLSPDDFGLLGIAMLAISAIETFSQTGFDTALIHKKNDVKSYLDTAWTASVIRGMAIFIILLITAPFIANFFNSPQATLIIQIIAISTLLSGFKNIGIVFFQKDLNFYKQFYYELSVTLVDLGVAITLAFILQNVWALVWAGLAANVVRVVLSYFVHPYRPHVKFDKSEFMDLFTYGKWFLVSSILVFLVTQGDDIFVGKMLGTTALGLYQMAYLISNVPTTEITHVISHVTFPAYAKLQNNLDKLREAYLDVLQLTAFISIPIAGGIYILAPEFTQIFLGEKWIPMVPAIQVLVIAGLIRSIQATTGPLLYGIGKPEIDAIWQFVRLIGLMAFIYPLTLQWGIWGASISVLVSILISTLGFCYMVIKIIRCKVTIFCKLIILPLMNTFLMILVIMILKNHLYLTSFYKFTFLVVVGIIVYILITLLLDNVLHYRIKRLIRMKLNVL